MGIIDCTLHICQYRPLTPAGSYIECPKFIQSKRAVVNVVNTDQKCFLWSILAAIHPATDNSSKLYNYEEYEHTLNLDGISFPVRLDQIRIFERNNPHISVNCYEYKVQESHAVIPIYLTKYRARQKHIDLLLLSENDRSHYCWIKNMSRLVAHRSKNHRKTFVCPHCIRPFTYEHSFANHFPDCSRYIRQKVDLPLPGKNILEWKSRGKTELSRFVIYCDFEAYLEPVPHTDSNTSKTVIIDEHKPSGFCAYTVSEDPQFPNRLVTYSGADCMDKFFQHLLDEQIRISTIEGLNIQMLPLSEIQQAKFDKAIECPTCRKPFSETNIKVKHHNHATGAFIGVRCNSCNLQLKTDRKLDKDRKCDFLDIPEKDNERSKYKYHISVIMHNLSRYDSHFIFRYLNPRMVQKYGKNTDKYPPNVEITALNLEQFISFDMFYLRFIDSMKFLNASLETLVKNLVDACDEPFDKFTHTRMHLKSDGPETDHLIYAKGLFPYEWFSGLHRFHETSLPPKDCFYSHLKEEGISDDEYERAQKMWTKFNCQNFKQYHDLYLTLDTVLLADVYQNFRKTAHASYGLDPSRYLTLPSFSWDACLKLTDVKLELLTDPEAHLFFENNLRGGISTISARHSKSNVPGTTSFDPSNPASYIFYVDANNLYGWAMTQPLPTSNFVFLSPWEVENFDVFQIPDDSKIGYVIECDLIYPPELHDAHNCYPLAPESLLITEDLISPYCKSFGLKHHESRKLVPNLMDKTKYVTYYANLKFYLEQGMKLTKIHRILSFDQSPWMKPFIDFNTAKRQASTTKVDQDLYKFVTNSNFGKTCERTRLRRNVQLVCNPFKIKKLTAKPQLEQFHIINHETALIDRVREKVILDKPIYCGFVILEVSKLLMYRYHYRVVKARYGENAKLLFTDTDSLAYHITTPDLYEDLKEIREHLDTSNYPKDHPLFSNENNKVLGKFKDECASVTPVEFVGLRSKMYSLLVDENKPSKKTAKGISSNFVRKHVTHDQYLHVLRSKTITNARFRNFQSKKQVIRTVELNKTCLSAYDDKRFLLSDSHFTLAYGHHRIKSMSRV